MTPPSSSAGSTGPLRSRKTRPPAARSLPRSIVLVGFMGAGKSTIGRILARALDCGFVDLDDELERRLGRSVPTLLRECGVEDFRRMESSVAEKILAGPPVVFATGGGWGAQPGRVASLQEAAHAVWLRVRPRTALARIGEALSDRPLLDVADPLAAARALLAERTPHYARCAIKIDTDNRAPDEVAHEILRRAELRSAKVRAGSSETVRIGSDEGKHGEASA